MKINNKNQTKYKWCWVAKEVLGGWKVSLECNKESFKLPKAIFTTMEEVNMVCNGNVVFIHLKNTKYPIK